MRKQIYWAVSGIVALVAWGAVLGFGGPGQEKERGSGEGFGMFSWDETVIGPEEMEALSSVAKSANVSVIYQTFSRECLEGPESAAFVAGMKDRGMDVFALMGDAAWAYESDGKTLIEQIRYVAEYNERHKDKGRIQGVMVDVEPYLLDEWDEGKEKRAELMAGYGACMERAYAYASERQLTFLVCIPTFYDATNEDILERLIAYGCDGVAVMNYNRKDEYGQIAKEVGFAREYGKEIICIYELQKPGKHQLEEINTYANEGLEALRQSAWRLGRQFGYDRLRFAYHYYKPLKELLEKEKGQ